MTQTNVNVDATVSIENKRYTCDQTGTVVDVPQWRRYGELRRAHADDANPVADWVLNYKGHDFVSAEAAAAWDAAQN